MKKAANIILIVLLVYFVALSIFLMNKSSVKLNEADEILNIYRPYLENIQKTLEVAIEKGKYFDPAYYLEYFDAYNNILTRLNEHNPEVFSVLPKRMKPVASKTTDFDGRGYLIKSPFNKLLEDISLTIELIDENYKNRTSLPEIKNDVFYDKWWFQMFVAPFIVSLLTGIVLMVMQKKYSPGNN